MRRLLTAIGILGVFAAAACAATDHCALAIAAGPAGALAAAIGLDGDPAPRPTAR